VSGSMPENMGQIRPEMTVLDVVYKYRQTEAVFKQYDQQAGECICCQALFESLQDVAARYNLDLKELLTDLETAANMF
jgi:hypothetical protein